MAKRTSNLQKTEWILPSNATLIASDYPEGPICEAEPREAVAETELRIFYTCEACLEYFQADQRRIARKRTCPRTLGLT